MTALFEVSAADMATTNDDWYTPRWIFEAAGVVFDMDVAAPMAPAFRTCPARQYLTLLDDRLFAEWNGTVWMNPPFSGPASWVDRFAAHPNGMALLPALPRARWLGVLLGSADAMTMIDAQFGRPDGSTGHLRWPMILAARGEPSHAVAKVAAADKYVRGAYHVRPEAS